MALLLDTHAAIWWWLDSPRLSARARTAIIDEEQSVYISSVTSIEIAIKFRIGKLAEFGDPRRRLPALLAADNFESLSISPSHALVAGLLTGDHRDPFDRILAAQALEEDLTLVTRDPELAAFGCKVLW